MEQLLLIQLYENGSLVYATEVSGSVELGRQELGEPEPFWLGEPDAGGIRRLVIGRHAEATLSRHHARVEMLASGRLRVENLSGKQPIVLEDGNILPAGGCVEVALPSELCVGGKVLRASLTSDAPTLTALDQKTLIPGQAVRPPTILDLPLDERIESESIVRWLQSALHVLQSAATSEDFFEQAALSMIEVAGLDSGTVLLRKGEDWQVAAFQCRGAAVSSHTWRPSQRVLRRVCEDKRTLWMQTGGSIAGSLGDVQAVVAAPILNRDGEPIGALYGDRRSVHPRSGIQKVEAMVVELLATSVSAGLARLRQEEAALAARIQFEQFFTPELSRQLEQQPDLLEGRDAEVTVLIADVIGFSRIIERVGSARTIDWIRDIMTVLSNCVSVHHGVVVDYVGDELMAMWGAPEPQADHPALACAAALEMLDALPGISQRWRDLLGEDTDVGIGINTGQAYVGNVGSTRKFKYGPLGATVNLASRIQGATKYLNARFVLGAATRARLGPEFEVRRLCTARVVNICEPVELYELRARGGSRFSVLRDRYEKALAEFEHGRFHDAARLLGEVLAQEPADGPTLALMSRTLEALGGSGPFEPVWQLPGK